MNKFSTTVEYLLSKQDVVQRARHAYNNGTRIIAKKTEKGKEKIESLNRFHLHLASPFPKYTQTTTYNLRCNFMSFIS
jgi:hypothetical protein